MKVILLDEVKGKGREGEIVDVARGFAVNYLFPRKMAVEATSGNVKQLEARKGNILKRESVRRDTAEGAAAAVAGKTVTVKAKSGDEGRLYGSVTTTLIAEAIHAQLGLEVDRRRMEVTGGPIKALGRYPVTVNVYHDVKAELLVDVVSESGEPAKAAPTPVPAPAVAEVPSEEAAVEAEETTDPDDMED